jgi:hypothetical protein
MRRATLLIGLVLLAACGSVGDVGGSSVAGVVTNVDPNAQRIDLNVLQPAAGGLALDRLSIYYDQNTRVVFQNQNYNPSDVTRYAIPARRLQLGDQLSVVGANDSGRYIAQTITVTTHVRE